MSLYMSCPSSANPFLHTIRPGACSPDQQDKPLRHQDRVLALPIPILASRTCSRTYSPLSRSSTPVLPFGRLRDSALSCPWEGGWVRSALSMMSNGSPSLRQHVILALSGKKLTADGPAWVSLQPPMSYCSSCPRSHASCSQAKRISSPVRDGHVTQQAVCPCWPPHGDLGHPRAPQVVDPVVTWT